MPHHPITLLRSCAVCSQASNDALAAEKTRMDVLLARQYNLISCMAEQGNSHSGDRAISLEEKTLGESLGCGAGMYTMR